MKITKINNVNDYIYCLTADDNGNLYYATSYIYRVTTKPFSKVCPLPESHDAIVYGGNNRMYVGGSYGIDVVYGENFEWKPEEKFQWNINTQALAVDENHVYLYVAATYNIFKIHIESQTVEIVAGSTKGYKDGPANEAQFDELSGIAVDSDDTIYVSETDNHCIRKIKDGIVSTLHPIALPSSPLPHKQHIIRNPRFIAQTYGNLYVCGFHENTKIIHLSSNTITTLKHKFDAVTCCQGKMYGISIQGLFVMETGWETIRLLWIGHMKEESSYCPLAKVPKDIISEIIQWL